MRVAAFVATASLFGLGALGACQNHTPPAATSAPASNDPRPPTEVTSRIEKLQEEEGDALARRDALTRAREQVSVDRAALDARKQKIVETGGDPRTIDAEEKAIVQREAKIAADEKDVAKKIDALLVGYQEVTTGAAAGKDVTAREAQVALREKDMARRERGVADRETTLAEREKELARRERDTCSVSPTIVQAPAPTPGSRYSRRDVEQFLTSARRKMSEKGLLGSDLPAPAKNLEREATSAMSSGDYGRARFAADQLVVTIDSMKVDKAFIVGKINRLNSAMKSSRLSADARRDVDDLFREATADYGDGKFASANGKLNRIFGALP